jgi:hypothetical protein
MRITIVNLALPASDESRVISLDGVMPNQPISESPSTPIFSDVSIPGRSSPGSTYTGGSARSINFGFTLHRDIIGSLIPSKVSTSEYDVNNLENANTNQPGLGGAQYNPDTGVMENTPQTTDGVVTVLRTPAGAFAESYRKKVKEIAKEFDELLLKLKALNYPIYTDHGVVTPRVYICIGDSIKLKGYASVTFTYDRPIDFQQFMVANVTFQCQEVVDIAWSAQEVIGGMTRYVTWHGNNGEAGGMNG